jgi:hypothetical protein
MANLLIPFTEMRDFCVSDKLSALNISWELDLHCPEVNINVDRIKKLARLAGLKKIAFYQYRDDLDLNFKNLDVVQQNASRSEQIETYRSELSSCGLEDEDEDDSADDKRKKNDQSENEFFSGYIGVNEIALNRLVPLLDHGETTISPRTWAFVINEALASGIYELAKEQVLYNVSNDRRNLAIITGVETLAFGISKYGLSVGGIALMGLSMSAVNQTFSAIRSKLRGENLISDRRLSLIPGYQSDRLSIVKALTKTLPIVTARKS